MYHINNINDEIQLRKIKNRKTVSHKFTGTCLSYTTTDRQHRLNVSVNDEEKERLQQLGITPLEDGTFFFIRPTVYGHPKDKYGMQYAYVEGLEGKEITFKIGINKRFPKIVHLSMVY